MKQEYKVMQPFKATAPISGAQQEFSPGEIVVCDTSEGGSTLTLQVGGSFTVYYLVERAVFEACCKWISRGPGG